jgi:hypothetical protein
LFGVGARAAPRQTLAVAGLQPGVGPQPPGTPPPPPPLSLQALPAGVPPAFAPLHVARGVFFGELEPLLELAQVHARRKGVRRVRGRGRCTLTAPSLRPHCTLTAPSLHPHCTLTVPSLRPHGWLWPRRTPPQPGGGRGGSPPPSPPLARAEGEAEGEAEGTGDC